MILDFKKIFGERNGDRTWILGGFSVEQEPDRCRCGASFIRKAGKLF
jgi:hypothetical protein